MSKGPQVIITIKDERTGMEAPIALDPKISDAILFYIIKYLDYKGNNPMEAAVQFFVQQGKDVATGMIRSEGAAETEQKVQDFVDILSPILNPEKAE